MAAAVVLPRLRSHVKRYLPNKGNLTARTRLEAFWGFHADVDSVRCGNVGLIEGRTGWKRMKAKTRLDCYRKRTEQRTKGIKERTPGTTANAARSANFTKEFFHRQFCAPCSFRRNEPTSLLACWRYGRQGYNALCTISLEAKAYYREGY